MGSHDPFGPLQHKLWQKGKAGSQIGSLTFDHKKLGINPTLCVQVECKTPLESSQRKIQHCFKPHPDRRSKQRVIVPQSSRSPKISSFTTPPWESRDKKPFGCRHRKRCKEYYVGEGDDFPQVWVMVSLVNPRSPMACPSTKGAPNSVLTNLLVGLMQIWMSN
jgi:hypothetical protein